MNIIHTIILGIVEGITEFLPISSTAHLEITQQFLGITTNDFIKSFEIAIQLGAIIAVIFFFKKKLLSSSFLYYRNIIIAFIPTGVIGFLLYKIIKTFLLGNILIVAFALLIGGVIIIFYERRISTNKDTLDNDHKENIETLSVKQLLILGASQALAVIPGVSRSGAVIISGRMQGFSKNLITEFAFVLAIPTMLAATAYDLLKSGFTFSSTEWGSIILGAIVSFIVAFVVIKWFLGYIQNNSFIIFGWYRVVLGLALLVLFL